MDHVHSRKEVSSETAFSQIDLLPFIIEFIYNRLANQIQTINNIPSPNPIVMSAPVFAQYLSIHPRDNSNHSRNEENPSVNNYRGNPRIDAVSPFPARTDRFPFIACLFATTVSVERSECEFHEVSQLLFCGCGNC